jgi:hypothetical protein
LDDQHIPVRAFTPIMRALAAAELPTDRER